MNKDYNNDSPHSQDSNQPPPQPPWHDEIAETPNPEDMSPPPPPLWYEEQANQNHGQIPSQEPFNPANWIAKAALPSDPIVKDTDNPSERCYITTHTPHAWLDRYIEYSRTLSPRGFDMLHEATGLWVMSSTIAGRAIIDFGGRWRHTSLMFTAVARSSVWAKSHTIGIGEKVLTDAGLEWRFLPTKASPQAIIEEMSDNKEVMKVLRALDGDGLSDEAHKALRNELSRLKNEIGPIYAHEGQRSWHISEFGSKIIAGMMRAGSPMADFSDFLREVNEKVKGQYTYRTRGHGKETINNPYLAVIADTTPADIRPFAKMGAPLWSNGFFPRFALIAPRGDEVPSKGRVAYKRTRERATPIELTEPLVNINLKLGRRKCYAPVLEKTTIGYSEDVWDAFYNYEGWIDENRLDTEDLDGTYARLAFEQCVSISTLLAVFDGSDQIRDEHNDRAIEICERIRRCTEDFYARMTESPISEKQAEQSQLEDRILKIIKSHHTKKEEWPTLRDIRKRTGKTKHYQLSREDIMKVIDVLMEAKALEEFKEDGKRAYRYKIVS
ncbi:MAG: DUF3987 domain-containing protein [Ardenticatenaceae bacterium]